MQSSGNNNANNYDGIEWIENREGDKKLGCEHILFRVIIDVLYFESYLGCSQELGYYLLLFYHQVKKKSLPNLIIMYLLSKSHYTGVLFYDL